MYTHKSVSTQMFMLLPSLTPTKLYLPPPPIPSSHFLSEDPIVLTLNGVAITSIQFISCTTVVHYHVL